MVADHRTLTGRVTIREAPIGLECKENGLCSVACLTMLKLPRKRKLFLAVLATSLFTLAFLLNQPALRERKEHIGLHLTRLHNQLALDLRVIPDNVTQQERRQTCSPVVNIAFVKTHKAGSSTVANILQRFGIRKNLSFALPNTRYRAYGYNYISRAGDVLKPTRLLPLRNGSHHGYNILYNHAIYNRTAFRMFMAANTHYISILREPFSQFVSAFEYYSARVMFSKIDRSILKAENPISMYLQNPYKFEKRLQYFSYVKNKQAEDLGLGWNEYFIPAKLNRYLETLRNDFTLVMIMEYFDESLLLLKRKLCWDLRDILYIPKNENKYKPKRNFTDTDHKRHEKLSHLDYKLYSFFLKSFEAELHNQTKDFFEELAYFKRLLQKVNHSCTSETLFYTAGTRWHDAFYLDKADCRLMFISELAGFDLLLERAGALDWSTINAYKAKQGAWSGSKSKVVEKINIKGDVSNTKVGVKTNEMDVKMVKSQEVIKSGKENVGLEQAKVQSKGVVSIGIRENTAQKIASKSIEQSVVKNHEVKNIGVEGGETVQDGAALDQAPVAVVPGLGVGGAAQAVIQGEQVAQDQSGIKVYTKDKV